MGDIINNAFLNNAIKNIIDTLFLLFDKDGSGTLNSNELGNHTNNPNTLRRLQNLEKDLLLQLGSFLVSESNPILIDALAVGASSNNGQDALESIGIGAFLDILAESADSSGPGSVFQFEGKCPSGKFNCKYIRPRPWLSMNYQPTAGIPLRYKYIQTMGSLLTKKRENSGIIRNATAHRKNTLVFLSRGKQCGLRSNCLAPAKCQQCTGNRNPNNNPI